jgi:hypothetical protein
VPWGTEANPKYPNCIFRPYTAPRAAEAGEPQNEILRRIGDRGLALAQKGIGKEHLDLWQHLLDEVQRLSSRPAIIEECARVCDKLADRARGIWESYVAKCRENPDNIGPGSQSWHQYYEACADAIRALAPREAAAPDELRKAYFEGYEDALKDRSAPAEVAETMREAIKRAVDDLDTWLAIILTNHKITATVRRVRDDLEQALNERKDEE